MKAAKGGNKSLTGGTNGSAFAPSRYTCVLPSTRRGSKSSRKRRVKPSLSELCANLKSLRNKSCSWTAVDLNDHIERIFDAILDGLLRKRCPRKCRRRRAVSPSSSHRCGCHDARLRRQRNSIRVRSRCCRMRSTWGGKSIGLGNTTALGAQREGVLSLMLLDGLRPAFFGLALGMAASIGAARLMRSMLYGISLQACLIPPYLCPSLPRCHWSLPQHALFQPGALRGSTRWRLSDRNKIT